jgi:hypothetical protein
MSKPSELPKNASAVELAGAIKSWLIAKIKLDAQVEARSHLARTRLAAMGELMQEIEAWEAK